MPNLKVLIYPILVSENACHGANCIALCNILLGYIVNDTV